MSKKELGRRLAGDGAGIAQIEARRRQIMRWLSGRHEPEIESARRVEAALGVPEGKLVEVVVRRRRGVAPKPTPREELAALHEELAELRGRVAALESGQPHQPDAPAEQRSA